MRCRLPRIANLSLLHAAALLLASCHPGPSEPTPSAASTDASSRTRADRHHEVHRILERDHRHVIPLRVDDELILPDDPAFDWRVDFEDPSGFERVTGASQNPRDESYRVTKAGPFRMMIYGDPKCLKTDPKCGTSKRRWDVTVAVQ
jgi:hypothetical protein